MNPLTRSYRDAVVSDEPCADDPLYEGSVIVHANGWLELEGTRLLSPSGDHHIDIDDDEDGVSSADAASRDGSNDAGGGSRTSRFTP